MKKSLIAAVLAMAVTGLPSAAFSQATAATEVSEHSVSVNLGLASNYRFRGIDQTNGKPTVQAGVDYGHASGVYLGTWASNVSWLSDAGGGTVSNSIEMDLYGGYKRSAGGIDYDVGLLRYFYPGTYPAGFTSPYTTELYVSASWRNFTLKYSHALTNLFGFDDSKGAGYLDLTGNFDVGNGFSLVAHVGHQRIPGGSVGGVPVRSRSDCSYTDWKLGVNREYSGLDLGLAYVGTNAKGGIGECYRNPYGRDQGKGTLVLSVAKSF
jgi:uncharacterized protein (TIGR02001 family)